MKSQIISDFYTNHRDELLRFAVSRLGNMQESEDLVQDVFVKMMGLDTIDEETVSSLGFTITANKITDIMRHRALRHKVESDVLYVSDAKHNPVERIAEYHDTLSIVNRGMRSLSPACARVYTMSLNDGKSTGEIADELNVSKRTIEAQLFTSRKKVRQYVRAAM